MKSQLIFLFAISITVQAQTNADNLDRTHYFKFADVTIPVSLIAISALSIDAKLSNYRFDVQDALSNQGRNKCKIDDYIQYSPLIATFSLDLCGIKAKHNIKERLILGSMSYATMAILVYGTKQIVGEKRPDTDARNSFPSGHTATVFMGAEILRKEYADKSLWISYSGYAVAVLVGYLRIYNNRHFINDVVAGASIGILSTKLSYWLYPKIFSRSRCRQLLPKTLL